MVPSRRAKPPKAVDNLGSLGGAFDVGRWQRSVSIGSSKQRDVEQMLARLADAFVHNLSHTVPEDWRLAFEPHAVSLSVPPAVGVYVRLAEATIVGCKRDAVVYDDKSDFGNCS